MGFPHGEVTGRVVKCLRPAEFLDDSFVQGDMDAGQGCASIIGRSQVLALPPQGNSFNPRAFPAMDMPTLCVGDPGNS